MAGKATKDEVTVSPEMIEAGRAALRDLGLDWDMWDLGRQTEIVTQIFKAMAAAQSDSPVG